MNIGVKLNRLEYVKFNEVNINDFKNLLNKPKVREHLIKHQLFDLDTVNSWVEEKIEVNSLQGCRVRAIYLNNALAGWCGIQLEQGKYEIAIVLDDKFWGIGKSVFADMMGWAREFGHDEVYIHFLHTRPEYRFLRKMSKKVYETELLGKKFTSYQLAVN